ncbi:glycosyltransferase [Microbacterium sp. NEAU-LLC]|uniref:Glycosyltransferase n=1 Tax=Microbacterium helvum TaxID=2773713 RepID=A0ABR8NS38_9MICO|nr:glycosyltransferase [Microbacterium helvum]MBD3942547.1 glycosyltransferase [Microbacterium helvum]
MILPVDNLPGQAWHSNDLLIRIAQGEQVGGEEGRHRGARPNPPLATADLKFGVASLELVAGDPDVHEALSTVRSTAFTDRDLTAYGVRVESMWVLDVLVGRHTGYAYDWSSFRAEVLESTCPRPEPSAPVDGIPLNTLLAILEIVHTHGFDEPIEHALLTLVFDRVVSGAALPQESRERFLGWLVQAGMSTQAREVLRRSKDSTWASLAFAAELEHPRFGGTFAAMLRRLNEPYRRFGLEEISLEGEGETPSARLSARPRSRAGAGPLVTVIMTCSDPGAVLLTSVSSLISQTYQDWELILMDDGSQVDSRPLLERVAMLDPRIRIVRNETSAGSFVRTNEALNLARGVFVAMQGVSEWSHPHRLEIQVRDLQANPMRLANTIFEAHITENFDLLDDQGARLIASERALMFRREPVLAAIGYYDSVRFGADVEFRDRIESVTRRPVPGLLPGAPLQFALCETADSRDRSRAGTADAAESVIYASATRWFLERVKAGAQDPYLAFPLSSRPFHAPSRWRSIDARSSEYDLIVVLDGRESSIREDFHAIVVDELRTAAAAGLRAAILQSDSPIGPQETTHFPAELQALIDADVITRISAAEAARASTVVVRHAAAAQGHPERRLLIETERVVIVEDPTAGDIRGRTIARPDVVRTVKAWFDVAPTWERALPSLPFPALTSVVLRDGRVRLTFATGVPTMVTAVRLTNESATLELVPEVKGNESVTCSADGDVVSGEDWAVEVDYSAGGGRMVTRRCPATSQTVIWNSTDLLAVRTEQGSLRFLAATSAAGVLTSREFIAEYTTAAVSAARIVGSRIEIEASGGSASAIVGLYALREVDGAVIRRRDFTRATSPTGQTTWTRPLAKFAEAKWEIFGSFRTPLGFAEFPLTLDSSMKMESSDTWQPQVLVRNRLIIDSPQASRFRRAVSRVTRSADSVVGARARHLMRLSDGENRARSHSATAGDYHFDASHSVARVEGVPALTVVMPVYNVEPYLDVAISSVLQQDFADLELIIVDDASTDGGRRIINKHWQRDPRVRVFGLDHNTLGGAGVPSNIGIRAARGTYVAFADSDDHVTKTGLASLVQTAELHAAEIVIGDFRTFSDKQKEGIDSYDRAVWSEFPVNRPISAFSHPALFRLSPVPWRKLYRRDFLEEHGILYPEGDYFYEDNPLHWFVLSRAHRVVASDEVVSYHRMEREGQTMSAQSYKLGSFVNHMNTILNFLATSTDEHRDVLFEAFFGFLDRSHWVVRNQSQASAAALIRRGLGDVYERAVAAAPTAPIPPLIRSRLATYRSAYPDVDLTVVVPVFNSADLLTQTLDSVLEMSGVKFNVLVVDDGSTDASAEIMRSYEDRYSNVHVFSQGNRGAGRARNSVIPLCTGRYTYFLDADDLVDADSLVAAVAQADLVSADLLFTQYRIEYTDEARSRGMFNADSEIWAMLPLAVGNEDRQRLLAGLINYPWNRIIRTTLLHDANIFFGPTVVHNDVLFHWHTIVSAQRIDYLDVEVCVHRKFATRDQVTNISDARRMAVLEALRGTYERISPLESYPAVQAVWEQFAANLLEWAKSRVPDALQSAYTERSDELMRSFSADNVTPASPVVARSHDR